MNGTQLNQGLGQVAPAVPSIVGFEQICITELCEAIYIEVTAKNNFILSFLSFVGITLGLFINIFQFPVGL